MANQEDKRLVDLRPDLPREQSATAAPVVVARNLPLMAKIDEVKPAATVAGQILMGTGHAPASSGGERMASVPEEKTLPQSEQRKPQEVRSPAAAALSDGYIRLEIHAEGGRLSVIGVHEVAGPITIPDTVAHGYVYEALVDNRRIGLGSIPDAGVRRAFANRDVEGPQGKHRFFAETSFDFFVRIPKTELSNATLPRITIVLHQVQEAPEHLSAEPLLIQPGVQATEAGRLSGMTLETLPATVRPSVERILRERETPK